MFKACAFLSIAINSVLSRRLSEVQSVRGNLGDHVILEIPHSTLSLKGREILVLNEADHFGTDDEFLHFKATKETKEELEKEMVEFNDITENWINDFETRMNQENHACFEEDCHKRSLQAFYSSYQQLSALHARVKDLVEEVDFAKISSIGSSYEGRDQLTVEIGDDSKPLVFYFCNIHAREWLTPMYCTYMTEMLLADGGHPLLDTFSFTILISANPDGYEFTWSDNNMWRKTRKPNPGSTCVGTDPNRNYDNNHCGPGTSNNPCSETYCGTAPFSEIEVKNIADYAVANADRLIAMNDVHSYSQLWMFPYAGVKDPTPDFDTQDKCSKAAVDAIALQSGGEWVYGPVYTTIYPAAGNSVDWFYDTAGVVYAMTAELRGRSFQPDASEIMPSNMEVFAAMTASLSCVADEVNLVLTPTIAAPTIPPTPAPTCGFFFC